MKFQVEEKWTKTDTIDVAIEDEAEFDTLLDRIVYCAMEKLGVCSR